MPAQEDYAREQANRALMQARAEMDRARQDLFIRQQDTQRASYAAAAVGGLGSAALGVGGYALGGYGNLRGQSLGPTFGAAGYPGPLGGIWPGGMGGPAQMGYGRALSVAVFGNTLWQAERFGATPQQVRELASLQVRTGALDALQRTTFGTLNTLSFGMLGRGARALGLETMLGGNEGRLAELISTVTSRIPGASLGQYASEFGRGVNVEGNALMRSRLMQKLSDVQRRTHFTTEELEAGAGSMLGVLSNTELQRLSGSGSPAQQMERLTTHMAKASEQFIQLSRSLGMSVEETRKFAGVISQVATSPDDIAAFGARVRAASNASGMGTEAMTMGMVGAGAYARGLFLGGPGMGMTAGSSQFAAQSSMLRMLASTQNDALLPAQYVKEYGGDAAFTKANYERRLGRVAGGANPQLLTLAAANPAAYRRLAGGKMGGMEFFGAVGDALTRDPFAARRAQFNPAAINAVSAGLDYSVWQQANAFRSNGMFFDDVQKWEFMGREMGMHPREAKIVADMFEARKAYINNMTGGDAEWTARAMALMQEVSAQGGSFKDMNELVSVAKDVGSSGMSGVRWALAERASRGDIDFKRVSRQGEMRVGSASAHMQLNAAKEFGMFLTNRLGAGGDDLLLPGRGGSLANSVKLAAEAPELAAMLKGMSSREMGSVSMSAKDVAAMFNLGGSAKERIDAALSAGLRSIGQSDTDVQRFLGMDATGRTAALSGMDSASLSKVALTAQVELLDGWRRRVNNGAAGSSPDLPLYFAFQGADATKMKDIVERLSTLGQ